MTRLDRHGEASRRQAGFTRRWFTSRCSNCSPTCARTVSRPSSFPAAASSSCGRGSETVYGIPPEQVIGSSDQDEAIELRDGKPVLVRLPEINFIDDKVWQARRHQPAHRPPPASPPSATPTATCRCSNGPPAGKGPRFGLIVHHTDAEREFAYDRESAFGQLDKGLDEAKAKGWTIVDMQNDWIQVFPPTP